MKLIEFSYRDANWELQNLEFGKASLIVGKNATGKSRTLRHLSNFLKLIKQTIGPLPIGEYRVKFEQENSDVFDYRLLINGGNMHNLPIREELYINNKIFLDRPAHKQAHVFNALLGQLEPINPPSNKLVIHTSRDVKKYPFFEDLAMWAEQSYGFKFGSITPDLHHVSFDTNISSLDSIATIFGALTIEDQARVLEDLRMVGFFVESVSVVDRIPVDNLQIRERGIKPIIEEQDLSQGMLRSLYLIIFIKYLISTGKASTIFIDDLCEGMDYERATKLGKLVFETCKNNNIQLIATSNDMFLMDVVELEYWNVLQRKDGVVTAINAKKYPELFANFKFTGLSNFDFFASDYIPQKIHK